jgi:hypothetical protein
MSFARNHVIVLAAVTVFVKEILRENVSPFDTCVTEISPVCSHMSLLMNSDVSNMNKTAILVGSVSTYVTIALKWKVMMLCY